MKYHQADQAAVQRRRRFSLVMVVVLVVIGYMLIVDIQNRTASQLEPQSAPSSAEKTQLVSEVIGELKVRERVSRDGYSRDQFGQGWATVAGCDMRNLILQRDLSDVIVDQADGCIVLSGVLESDPYTEERIEFLRGADTSSAIQIDHVVALSDAWQKGAQNLDPDQRQSFANDPLNLLAVDGPANMQKGDADAAKWLPAATYRCRYVARQVAVKIKYAIWVTRQELASFKRVLQRCPDQRLPIEAAAHD